MTQRGQGPVTLSRTDSPILSTCPIQAFSTKSFSPLEVSTTMFGQNRRTSNRPCGYSVRNRSSVAVVSRCNQRTVEESTLRQTEVSDRVAMIEALDIWPVL